MVRIERFIDQTSGRANEPRAAPGPAPLHRLAPDPSAAATKQRPPHHHPAVQRRCANAPTRPSPSWTGSPNTELTLGSCQQNDLDRWLTDATATHREPAGHFIRWAHKNKVTSVRVGARRWIGPTRPLDDQHRWNIARRLLHDDTLKPDDRLAGLLVLLYAQTPAAICRMTIDRRRTRRRPGPLAPGQLHPYTCPNPSPPGPIGRRKPQGPRNHRRVDPFALALSRRPARTADQHRPADPTAEPTRTSAPEPLAAPHCSSSPPRSPPRSWPAPSASTPTSPSPGNVSPPATGPTTPPRSAADHL